VNLTSNLGCITTCDDVSIAKASSDSHCQGHIYVVAEKRKGIKEFEIERKQSKKQKQSMQETNTENKSFVMGLRVDNVAQLKFFVDES
jgi:hypothetical protein